MTPCPDCGWHRACCTCPPKLKPVKRGKYTPEQRDTYLKRARDLRASLKAQGLCTICRTRPAAQAWMGFKNTTCELCRERQARLYREHEVQVAPVDFCLDCLGANFHRDDCPNMDTLISLDVRIERVLQGTLAPRLVPPRDDKPAPREELTPGTVEDGRSRDEGLPESAWGETECPVPTGSTYTTLPVLRTHRSL